MKFYAVAKGQKVGIWTSWREIQPLVTGYPGAKYKSFATRSMAEAWIRDSTSAPNTSASVQTSPYVPITTSPPVSNLTAIEDYYVYTDGSCVKQVGGWGAVVVDPKTNQILGEYYGKVPYFPCTNNKAELYAILAVVNSWPDKTIRLWTDSMYSLNAVTKWVHGWKRNGWKTANGKPVENQDLIGSISELLPQRSIQFSHVAAHQNVTDGHHEFNERADQLANAGRTVQ